MSGVVVCWRIASDTPDYPADDLRGKGAERFPGRWNRPGTPMVYAASSRALACLETVVHFGAASRLPLNRYLVAIRVPESLWNARIRFDAVRDVGWNAQPAGQVSLDWGTDWARGRGTVLAEVPSVIVPEESNFLINPAAAGAARLEAVRLRPWTYDGRPRPETLDRGGRVSS